jgi:hypothetical protein
MKNFLHISIEVLMYIFGYTLMITICACIIGVDISTTTKLVVMTMSLVGTTFFGIIYAKNNTKTQTRRGESQPRKLGRQDFVLFQIH